uniref:Mitochondrial calcium uniporter MCU, calcium, ion channel, eukaryotic n=1 Tax=Myoviridae sp. ctOv05 TaxID=2825094 RepID=A0A8S5P5M8_9CAUD|nr:MAG TPA: Mitochondrial calcium uniporter MCU, calcium, ion channel, eukaryotic [Myoviridae sp. ctOv05]
MVYLPLAPSQISWLLHFQQPLSRTEKIVNSKPIS